MTVDGGSCYEVASRAGRFPMRHWAVSTSKKDAGLTTHLDVSLKVFLCDKLPCL